MIALTKNIKELIDLTDLFIIDIKHFNSEKCKNLVGFSNKKEISFIKYLDEINKPVWLRQVLIPGYTDNTQDLQNLGKFVSKLKNVQKFEFLPYHTMGKYKWKNLGLNYELEDVREANQDDIRRAKEISKL